MNKYLALALVAALVLAGWMARGTGGEDQTAALRAATHTRDSILARNAEKEIEAEAEADSLRDVIARVRKASTNLGRRADTVLVPESTWVYVTDTLVPKCEQCAARLDTLVRQSRDERRAAHSLDSLQSLALVRLQQKLKQERMRGRFGVFVGYGVQRGAEGELRSGVTVGVGVRVWP